MIPLMALGRGARGAQLFPQVGVQLRCPAAAESSARTRSGTWAGHRDRQNLHLALQSRYRGSRRMVFTRPRPNPDISLADRRPRLDESRRGLRRERELKRGPLWYVRLAYQTVESIQD